MKYKNLLLIFLSVFFILFAGMSYSALTSEEEAVKKAYDNWCNAISLAKGDPEVVVKFYAPEAILMPTLKGEMLVNENKGLNSYFKNLTSYPNIKCVPKKNKIHMHGELATNSGFYTFAYTDKDGKKQEIIARFTFVYKKNGNQWMIIKHHSCKVP